MRILQTAIAVLIGVASVARAQSTGTINGRVTDQSGAEIVDAPVSVTNTGTSQVRNTVTNAQGLYTYNSGPATRTLQCQSRGLRIRAGGETGSDRVSRIGPHT